MMDLVQEVFCKVKIIIKILIVGARQLCSLMNTQDESWIACIEHAWYVSSNVYIATVS